MSRYYQMEIATGRIKAGKMDAVKEACAAEWDLEPSEIDVYEGRVNATSNGNLSGGESEEEFVDRLTKAIWKANGGVCRVEVLATCKEELPYTKHERTKADYKRLMDTQGERK